MSENLVQIKFSDNVVFTATSDTFWKNTTDVVWISPSVLFSSMRDYADRRYWSDDIIAYTPPQFNAPSAHGGYAEMVFGEIQLVLSVFQGQVSAGNSGFEDGDVMWADGDIDWFSSAVLTGDAMLWPPQRELFLTQQYTEDDESGLVILFNGVGHLSNLDRESVTYDLYAEKTEAIDLLEEGTDYDGNTVVLPRAMGTVRHVNPIRLADVGAYPTYHKGYLAGSSLAKPISGFSKVNATTIQAYCASHGFSNGNTVTIEAAYGGTDDGDYDYNGDYVITVVDGNRFNFIKAWIESGTSIVTAACYVTANMANYLLVYDDGIPIPDNVTDNGNGTFSLDSSPVGEITMSGVGSIDTLSDLISWACNSTHLQLSYVYNSGIEENPSPSMEYWANSQSVLIDFLSAVAMYFYHILYVSGGTMIAVSMDNDNGSRTLTEYDFFSATYEYPAPTSKITATWSEAKAIQTEGVMVKREDKEAASLSIYPYGSENSITPYQATLSDIQTRLNAILAYDLMPQVHVQIPLSDDLPVPGEKIIFTDYSSYNNILAVEMWCRNIQYDFENEVVDISGEGIVG